MLQLFTYKDMLQIKKYFFARSACDIVLGKETGMMRFWLQALYM